MSELSDVTLLVGSPCVTRHRTTGLLTRSTQVLVSLGENPHIPGNYNILVT